MEMSKIDPHFSITCCTSRNRHSTWHGCLAHLHDIVASSHKRLTKMIANKFSHLLCILASHTHSHCTSTYTQLRTHLHFTYILILHIHNCKLSWYITLCNCQFTCQVYLPVPFNQHTLHIDTHLCTTGTNALII